MTIITPIIMAGGSGTRLWPLSRRLSPKQFHPVVTDQAMLTDTMTRLQAISDVEIDDPIVVCGRDHRSLVEESAAAAGIDDISLVLEPVGRNTAPVAIIGANIVRERHPDGLVLLLPADHFIADTPAFSAAVIQAAKAASSGYITTFGISPEHPETGYGYICRGESIGENAYLVDRFVEKPDLATAQAYLADERFTWNAGIFLFSANAFLQEAEKHAPDIFAKSAEALAAASNDGRVITLDEASFSAIRADSIDYAVMERTNQAAVVGPVRMGWNDIGSWLAVRNMTDNTSDQAADKSIMKDCKQTMVRSTGPMVAAVGLENVIIVATGDAVLVIDADRAQDVKSIVDELKAKGREDLL